MMKFGQNYLFGSNLNLDHYQSRILLRKAAFKFVKIFNGLYNIIMENVFLQYLFWQFLEMPGNILKAWKNFLKFNLNYFSIPLLLKTLFSPWRRYRMSYGKGFDIGRYFTAFFSNLIFRILGAIMRVFLIIIGLLVEIFLIFAGIIIFFGWIALPALLIVGLIFGFKILF